MRTNIVIDDTLLQQALKLTGLRTKREVVEMGLRSLLQVRQQAQIKRFKGKLDWQGDLPTMRQDP